MKFYLGTHRPQWLGRTDVPLFVSHRTLRTRKTLPQALGEWALDSGAFSELTQYGEWRTTVEEYVDAVARYQDEIGRLEWAAPMDWMCQPEMLDRTGLSVREHQDRTIENYLELRDQGPFIPVLQGWTRDDYAAHMDLYKEAAVDLQSLPTVGVGSVCSRQATTEIGAVMRLIAGQGMSIHGFGVKKAGIHQWGAMMKSADSMSWSFGARHRPALPGCEHKSCQNCLEFALLWRQELLAAPIKQELFMAGA